MKNTSGSALLAAALMGWGQACAAFEVAPYFQAWSGGSLQQARQAAGLDHAILAFGITNGSCHLASHLRWRFGEARRFVEAGNTLGISMGGADGVYAEVACSDAQLLALLRDLLERSGVRHVDWDVEGRQLGNTAASERRGRVTAQLQAQYPDLQVSFTVSGRLDGLSGESMRMLRTALSEGARIDRVNVMTMTFGGVAVGGLSPPTMAQASMLSFQAAADQVAGLFPSRTRLQIHAMMGITPMIGANDDDTVFTLADAQTIADFVRTQGIGLVSYWAFQRDREQRVTGRKPLAAYSGVVQPDHQFHRIFKAARNSHCEPAPWQEGRHYEAGATVMHAGQLYRATRANPGFVPTISTHYWSPHRCTGPWAQDASKTRRAS